MVNSEISRAAIDGPEIGRPEKAARRAGLSGLANLCSYNSEALLQAAIRNVMNEVLHRDFEHDDWNGREAAVKTLTPEEAQLVRDANPSVSPWRVVGAQAFAGMLCAGIAWFVTQQAGVVWSALYGAAATVLPSALLARGMTRGTRNPVAAAAGFMFWEMLKIGVAMVMLVIAARVVPQLSWPALLLTMVVCIKINWFALLWRGSAKNVKVSGHKHGN